MRSFCTCSSIYLFFLWGVLSLCWVGGYRIFFVFFHPFSLFERNHGKTINSTEGLGLLIADEGHRLKNSSETKTTKALKACPAAMRLVLVSELLARQTGSTAKGSLV